MEEKERQYCYYFFHEAPFSGYCGVNGTVLGLCPGAPSGTICRYAAWTISAHTIPKVRGLGSVDAAGKSVVIKQVWPA
jgi:hypothetical protein